MKMGNDFRVKRAMFLMIRNGNIKKREGVK
jgi:hypothetical protein